jgi:heat shock protein 1/8
MAEKDEFEDKLKDLEGTCAPILTKVHSAGGETGAAAAGEGPDTPHGGGQRGPTVEEVD